MSKIDQKLQNFIVEGGNFTSDVNTELEPTTPSVSSTPKLPVKTLSLNDVFLKLVDVSKEIRRFEVKCFNQFDNITSRLNTLESEIKNFQGKAANFELVQDEAILKGNPAIKSIAIFDEKSTLLEDDSFKERLIKELKNIGGSSTQAHISNIIRRCFSPSVLLLFTLKGQGKDKRNFSATPFYVCLIGKCI